VHTKNLQRIPAEQEGYVHLIGRCTVTGKPHTTPAVSLEALEAFESGVFAQLAFPELSADEREFLISGTTGEGWEMLFGKEEDEEP